MTAPPEDISKLREDVLKHLDGVEHELIVAFLDRKIFAEIRDAIVERFPESDGTFLNSYAGLYARGQIMVVRRLADSHRRKPDSLWWLIQRIRTNPAVALGEVADETRLDELQARLRSQAADVVRVANTRIAHRDPRGPPRDVTFDEIDQALEHVASIANDVTLLLRDAKVGYEYIAILPDWQECLRLSLFPIGFDAYGWPDPGGYT